MAAEQPARERAILEPHLVAYIDLLGFRSAVESPSPDVAAQILATLQEFKGAEQEFEIRVEPQGQGQQTTFVKPGISTFSDHLVMSFNLVDLHGSSIGFYQAFMSVRMIANAVAHRARQFDCLIRGAVTRGLLHHSGGIVFGDGLVRAYEMESRQAKYPRIIVDENVLIGTTIGDNVDSAMFPDADGKWCIDYMTAYLETLDQQYGSGPSPQGCTDRRAWALATRAKAIDKIREYEAAGDKRATENWTWYARRFEAAMLASNPFRFSMDGSPLQFPEIV